MRITWRGLELPTRVERDKDVSSDGYGRFYIEPFERGFGTTIGNSLRRVLLSSLEGVVYLERVAVNNPKNIIRTKKAIKKGFENQLNSKGFSLIEVLAQCPVDWGMTPEESIKRVETEVIKAFPLGIYKDK